MNGLAVLVVALLVVPAVGSLALLLAGPRADAWAVRFGVVVTGIGLTRPPMRLIRFEPTAWITAPAARKPSALNAACTSRW